MRDGIPLVDLRGTIISWLVLIGKKILELIEIQNRSEFYIHSRFCVGSLFRVAKDQTFRLRQIFIYCRKRLFIKKLEVKNTRNKACV